LEASKVFIDQMPGREALIFFQNYLFSSKDGIYATIEPVDLYLRLMIGILITWILLDDRLAGETVGGRQEGCQGAGLLHA
jgi:hypothetical protein